MRILALESEPEIREFLQTALSGSDRSVEFVRERKKIGDFLAKGSDCPSLVILDATSLSEDGIVTLREIRRRDVSLPVIVLSRAASTAIESMAGRASRFLSKPVSQEDLREAVDQLLASTSDIHRANGTSTVGNRPELNLRTCKWHQEIAPLLGRLARYDVPVLLQGETGVGKEVLARHIHDNSLRAGKIFLKLNCAALPSELVESELFGHERGAFTGAFRSNPGKFELADGGTILLDEIGDMDLRLQAKLLQVLQDREFFRIGAKVATRVNVRVIAATHREMEACLEDGQFRQDLYYRLNVVNIVIPPLRERLDEIISLAAFFLRKHAEDGPVPEIGPELTSALHHHHWPGNIRELENLMRRYLVVKNPRAMVEDLNRVNGRGAQGNRRQVFPSARVNGSLEPGASIGDTSLGAPFARRAYSTGTPLPVSPQPLPEEDSELAKVDKVEQVRKSAEIEVIMRALYSTQWNRKRAAFQLGIDYKALLYKMKKWNIDSMRPIDAPDR